ncbi:RNA polymerase subunit sigma-54 [Paracoccus sp. (in: a-proteobacteria)]|uniref:RNA polymerase factor sigma-54 n=1 Tax=Paracoccus sp. TaxID=267 RepID=UPI003A8985CA
MLRQEQTQSRSLALSQQMRLSLDVLRMDGGRLRRWLRVQGGRHEALELADTARQVTARQELQAQAGLLRLGPEDARIAQELVHCLDDHGWLADPLPQVARWLETTPARIAALLPVLQQLDPPGVFARDLTESLRLQLQARNRLDPVIARLLDRLDLATAGDLAAIAAHCGCDAEDAAGMLADLRALSPWPLSEGPGLPPPELNLTADGRALLLSHDLIRLRDKGAGVAHGIVQAVEGRAQTLSRIGAALALAQRDWLNRQGPLRPLTLTALARGLDLHKSTVSRAIAGVRAQTPQGIVALSDLLPRRVSPRNPHLHRPQALAMIAALLADWPADQRYSDTRMAHRLADAGLILSRRGVAKYRAELTHR